MTCGLSPWYHSIRINGLNALADLTILDRLTALADSTRSRLLLVLDRHELTVSELCQVLQLPQSTVSRHLKLLGDDGWVVVRADGTSRRYSVAPSLDAGARRLWQLVRGQVAEDVTAEQDTERLRSVLAERRTRSEEFFATSAGQWDALRTELFGQRADLAALPPAGRAESFGGPGLDGIAPLLRELRAALDDASHAAERASQVARDLGSFLSPGEPG